MRRVSLCVLCCVMGCRNDAAPIVSTAVGGGHAEPGASGDEGGMGGPSTPGTQEAEGGQLGLDSSCISERVSLAEIHSGRVRSGVPVLTGPLLLSSQKFLISEAKSGSCLWGAYAKDPERQGAGSGLLLVSFGAEHREGEACRSGADGLPDDAAPGDIVDARGFVDTFAPSSCAGVAPALQLRVDAACPLGRRGSGDPPEPATIDLELADRLAGGSDSKLIADWGGALVRLENVSALQDRQDGDAVFPFGVVQLAETQLELRSRLYYFDLSEGGPKSSQKSPRYAFPAQFPSVTGILLLDYCDWVLAPRDRCVDAPGGEGCRQAIGP